MSDQCWGCAGHIYMDILQKIIDIALFNIVNNIYKYPEHPKGNKM